MPLILFPTSNEGRINADGDRCCRPRSCWLAGEPGRELLTDQQATPTECLRAPASIEGQQVLQYASSDAVGHEGGQVGLQLAQFRCRSATWRPSNARLSVVAGSTEKPGKPHRHFAEQGRDAVRPPILHVASLAAGSAIRSEHPMAGGLPSDNRPLDVSQKLLGLEQGQTQIRDIVETVRPADLCQVGAPTTGIILTRNQPQHPSHPRSPSRQMAGSIVTPAALFPHSVDTPDRSCNLPGPAIARPDR